MAGHAQVTGSILGTVTDQTGGVISDAKISVKNLETGATREVASDDTGNYRILSLPLGQQELRVEQKGFKPFLRTGIDLHIGEQAVINVTLALSPADTVTVVSEAPVVNVTTASVSGFVDDRQIKDLPLNGRSFDDLIALNPGTINYSALKSPNTSTSNGNTFSVAGRRTSENLFLLNGVEYMGSSQLAVTPGGTSGYLLGVDGIREFNVLTDTYSAEYGKRAGAQVSAVTQSGTNEFHGTVFEFVRNSAFDSPGPFDQGNVAPFHRNQFGGAAGGPLKKDRLFVFGNYEGFRQSQNVTSVSVVPDTSARTGQIPDPCTGIPATVPKFNSFMLGYMAFWPVANGPELTVPTAAKNSLGGPCANTSPVVASGTAKAFYNPNAHIREDFGTSRVDYHVGSNDNLSAAYTVDDGNSLIPLADPLFASYTPLRMQVLSLTETRIISNSVLNIAMFGFSRASFALASQPLVTLPSNLSFVSGMGPGGIVVGGGATTTANGSITSAGPNNAAGVNNHRNLFTFQDDMRITHGMHQLDFGVWFQRLQDNEDSASRQLGQATFLSLTTLLQGTVTNFQVVPMHTELGWRSLMGAWYVDDTIRVRRNLTIEAGLRQEFTTGWNEAYGRASNYVESPQGVLVTNPIVGNSVYTQNNAIRLFSPRFSVAWDVFGTGKTAVRAGYGMYYSLIDDLAFLQNSLPPFNGAETLTGPIFPTVPPNPPNKTLPINPGPPPKGTIYAPQGIQSNAKTPAVQEWNLSIEQQLSHDTSLRVAYVGSFGVHGLLSVDPNTISAQICATPTCAAGGTATVASTVPMGTVYIPGPNTKRPNPALSAGFFWLTEGNSSYNALEADVTHRVGKGLEFRGNYTWAKNLDINSGLTGAQANNQAQMVLNRNNLREDWGPSALTPTSQASISADYELPFGHNQRWMSDVSRLRSRFVSGWQVNGIGTFLSGFPFTPLIGSNRSGDGDTRNPDRPSINPSFTGPVVTGNPNQWFNPAAFILPTAGTYGNLGRGTLSGPGLADVDFSLFKNTAVTERTNLQFRAEFFNIFNRSNYGPLNTTVFSSGNASPSAGLITTTATYPRQIQLGLKLLF
ncbi:MAG TPA: carboxypeptidase regulatory-like domain-containing protein [Candidatus Saccharimonadales bacterium]|nr:carboxypeptidase regulatory-like domain-containing protein [Candidatus Saccharimonadales bacterium]